MKAHKRSPNRPVFQLRPVARAVFGIFLTGVAATSHALPTGGVIGAGSATLNQAGSTLTVQQASPRLAINWQSFGIGTGESVVFKQPDASAIALNRILGQDPSVILGSLSANGQVFLLNPNGVLFGAGAQVDVGGIVASTLGLSDADFLAGRYTFANTGNAGSVVNKGTIRASEGGYVALIGPQVANEGVIAARLGTAALGAGDQVTLQLEGNSLVGFSVDKAALDALATNKQLIQADGGAVILSAKAKDALLNTVVNNEGVVEARSVSVKNGVIRLEGGPSGVVSVTGRLDASGANAAEAGGTVTITGDKVGLMDRAVVDASGHAGGGSVLVGGDYRGKNAAVQNASRTYVAPTATIKADARDAGDGGKVIVWADDATRFFGVISAKGGANGGSGGFVETSGKVVLESTGAVDASAANGRAGAWLLDPNNITIQTAGANTNVTASPNFTATNDNAIVTTGSIVTALNAGTSVTVTTASAGANTQAGDITVANAIGKTAGANATLTLNATNNIAFNAGANLTSTANQLNVTLNAGGSITNPANVNTNGGALTFNATGAINLAGAITADGGAGAPGRNAGNVTITGAGAVTTAAITATGGAGNSAGQPGGNGGAISVTSAGAISTGALTANGGASGGATAAGGNAGSIAVTNDSVLAGTVTTGALTARTGAAAGATLSGAAGSIAVTNNAAALLTTGLIDTSGQAGGDVALTSFGGITVGSTITTSGGALVAGTAAAGRNSGNVTIRGVNRSVTGAITASGGSAVVAGNVGGNAGTVLITGTDGTSATAGTLSTAAITASTGGSSGTVASGTAGRITLEGTTVSATTLTTTGGANGAGGDITARATSGLLNVTGAIASTGGTANASSAGSNAGDITLSGVGVATTTIAANGSGALTAGSNQPGGAGGLVQITSTNGVTTTAIGASGGAATTTNANGGNAGSITIANSTAGNVSLGALTMNAGASTGTATSVAGSINVTNTATGAFLQTGAIDTRGIANSAGGNVTLSSQGALQFGVAATIQTTAGASLAGVAGQAGGNVNLNGASVTTTGAITTSGGAGSGTDLVGGNAGNIAVTAASGTINLSAGPLTAIGGGASAAGNANGGAGGAVLLDAGSGSTMAIPNITTTGGNHVGAGTAGAGGNITLADAVLLTANTTIAATGGSAGFGTGGNVQFQSTVDSSGANRTLTVNTGGTTTFGGAVGNMTPLASLATNVGGSTLINGGSITTTGDQTYNGAVSTGGATALTATAGALIATGIVTATAGTLILAADAAKDISFVNAANNFGTVAITGGRNVTLADANDLTLGASTVGETLTAVAGGTITLVGSLTAGGAGDSIVLAPRANFVNTAGAGALNAGAGRWLVYSTDPTLNSFGGLASGNQALWNRTYPAAVPESGNRYVFSTQPTITFTSTNVAKTYGQDATATVAGAYSVAGFVNAAAYGGVFTQDASANAVSGAPGVTSLGSPGTAPVAGSPYAIDVNVIGVTTTTGYAKAAASIGRLTVNAAPLTISADDKSKVYGDADPVLTATYTGFQNGETPAVVTGLALSAPTGAAASVIGSPHTITASGASSPNYTISYIDGQLIVTPRPIAVAANAQTKAYGDAEPVLTYVIGGGGLVYGDTLAGSLTRVAGETVAGSPYSILQGTVTNAANPNYAISYTGNALTITPATLIGSIMAANKVYDANTSATITSRTLSGVIAGDAVSYVGGTASFADKNAGANKTVTATGLALAGTDAGNYTVNTTATTTANITRAPLTIAATTNRKTYDATTSAAATPTVAGLQPGDTATGLVQIYDNKNAGTGKTLAVSAYTVNDGNGGSNYSVSTVDNTTGVIDPAALTYVANPASVAQGTPFPPFTGTVAGFVGGDTLASATTGNLAFNTSAANSNTAGVYPIDGSGLTANFGNYAFAQAPTNATALTIEPGGNPIVPHVIPDGYLGALASAAQTESTCAELQDGQRSETLCGAQQNFRQSEQVNLVPGWRRVIDLGTLSLTVEGEGVRLPEGTRIQ